MILRLCAVLMLMLTWSCSGDEKAAEEPVAPSEAKVPDSPGDAGQTAEKPAGEGAAATAETPAPVEKSTSPAPTGEVKETGTSAGEMTVAAGALNVRSGAGMKNGVVRVLKKGEKVTPASCDKGWCKLGEGEFVSKKYLN